MKQFTVVILLILISGCNGGKKESTSNQIDKKITHDEKIVSTQSTKPIDSLRDPYSQYYLADKNPKEIGQMILEDSVNPTDNNVTFRIMDSLLANNHEDRKFYFKVYTKILDKADGALAEAVGIPGMRYVESYTKEFANLSSDLTFEQLHSWANRIGWEILFDSQKDPIEDGENFIIKLKSNCSDIDLTGKKNLDNFCELIIQTVKENTDNK
jgi:hypothetical protein